jgi:hypothetical protein
MPKNRGRGIWKFVSDLFRKESGARSFMATGVLYVLPTWFGVLYSITQYLEKRAQFAASRTRAPEDVWVDLTLPIVIGITLSATSWAILTVLQHRANIQTSEQYKLMRQAMGRIPDSQLIRGLAGDQPEQFLGFLAKERQDQEKGLLTLKEQGMWHLTTPRAYETIVHFIQHATNVHIVDHDIRRWLELLDEPGQPATSTTFNYSRHILGVSHDGFVKGRLRNYQRIFILNPSLGLNLEPNPVWPEWTDAPPLVRVLLTIWDFEQRLANAVGMKDRQNFGTRVLIWNNRVVAGQLEKQVNHYQDIVMVDGEVCFHENLNYKLQVVPVNSFETQSYLWTSRDYVRPIPEFYEQLWKKAKPASHFQAVTAWLEHFPSEHQVLDIDSETPAK